MQWITLVEVQWSDRWTKNKPGKHVNQETGSSKRNQQGGSRIFQQNLREILAGVISIILIFEVKKSFIAFPMSRHMQYICVVQDFQFKFGGIVIKIPHLNREEKSGMGSVQAIPSGPRWAHLACSVSRSEHRICLILPMAIASNVFALRECWGVTRAFWARPLQDMHFLFSDINSLLSTTHQ